MAKPFFRSCISIVGKLGLELKLLATTFTRSSNSTYRTFPSPFIGRSLRLAKKVFKSLTAVS
ncbi:MAG: hypothetical protein RLZZ381_957 [Cyanobacteriota bacterium]|jgi:hypothetical protein